VGFSKVRHIIELLVAPTVVRIGLRRGKDEWRRGKMCIIHLNITNVRINYIEVRGIKKGK